MTLETPPAARTCRLCGGSVSEIFDFGRQPVSNAFVKAEDTGREAFHHLAVGICSSCSMVQLSDELPREAMFHEDYPYRSSESALMRQHFEAFAGNLVRTELTGPDPFVVEIGCNDGIMLKTVSDHGVRHLGVDPSRGAAEAAAAKGIDVRVDFFEESVAREIRQAHGRADVIFSANTFSHISYIDSIFRGIDELLADDGLFVFEDRYLGDIVEKNYFDQIYDEHFYLFSLHSVRAMVERFGFELVDAQRLAVHGGAVRYSVARPGARKPGTALPRLFAHERDLGLNDRVKLARFGVNIRRIRHDLVALLTELKGKGFRVAGYGATSKSATVLNYCGIGTDLVECVYDSTPEKQGRLTPGSHLPVVAPERFAEDYPDYVVLFAWNHAEEILAKEQAFTAQGGRWILYVPDVHVLGGGGLAAAA
ncbi:class I SAM-dependent methyltransferase [Amycolatopsis sp. NPDC021455]|uniref:class I SAM-dependent methyltransferase n=1 Tax=Amycolatopsis sp. NPDC021455 TaxID=3154901 RepID=UPI003402F189